jgi:signal transduction histidine kinase
MFAVAAAAIVGTAWFELAMMRAGTPAQFGAAVRWIHVPLGVLVIALVLVLWQYFGTGRWWLAAGAIGARLVAVAATVVSPAGASYREVTSVHPIRFLGQWVSVAEGVESPWAWAGRISSLLVCAFAVDASVRYWRRTDPDTRRRVWVGATLAFFSLAAMVHSALVQHGVIEAPYVVSLFLLGVVGATGAELTRDVVQAAVLARRLREAEIQATLAAESASFGVWVWDVDADRVWLSDRARDLFRFPAPFEPTVGQMLERIHPDDREQVRRAIERALATEEDLLVESRIPNGAGPVRWVSIRGRRDGGDPGPGRVLRGVSVDVTERRQAESEARRNREEITHLARVALANELSGTLAHELNQPLGAILSNAQALQRLLARDPADLDEIRAIVDDIVADDQRAGNIIERVRRLIRKDEPEWERLDVANVVAQALRLVRRDLADREIALTTDYAAALPAVRGDGTQLQQVVLNLVMNAIDAMSHTPPRGRVLRVGVARADGGGVRVWVSDTGPGIPEGILDRILEHFVTTKAHGIGMGLAICRTIVEGHGGRLRAGNNPDVGASVEFTLPAEQDSPP